jgi:preprotein translocase subunit SecG
MAAFITIIHILACILLIAVILMQAGRGGGLTEGFASAESMFGAKTNVFMVRTTAIVALVFLVTSLGLAYLSAERQASLIEKVSRTVEQKKDIQPTSVQAPVPSPAQTQPAAPSTEQSVNQETVPAPDGS